MKDIIIVIPARYNSSRFPGKPLVKIAGIPMLKRVADIAQSVCNKNNRCHYIVATDDARIMAFCQQNNLPFKLTAPACQSGTERCWDAVSQLDQKPEFIINLQGDNPLCPPSVIEAILADWCRSKAAVVSAYLALDWIEYDHFSATKQATPFSGTTVEVDHHGYAMTFSKQILPVIRHIDKAKQTLVISPVKRHIGLYGYSYIALKQYFKLPESLYEQSDIEGLEQMRFLVNGIKIKMVEISFGSRKSSSGVDSPEDVKRVERILTEFGELDLG